ncbi:hypothetical protein RYX36_033062, partial [Vicia faba]
QVAATLEELFGCYTAKNDPFIKELKGPWEAIEDVEITSEHKPDPTTPIGKRQLPGGSSESTSFEGLCDGELSSNKLKMIIKLE